MNRDDLDRTLGALEAGLRVRDIATFEMATRDVGQSASAILGEDALLDFDAIPLARDGAVVGVLERSARFTGEAAETVMRPVDGSILVAADHPLGQFLRAFRSTPETPFRLVVGGAGISGIVTTSDLLKLPVRLLVFAVVAHLEAVLSRTIEQHHPDHRRWIGYLHSERRQDLEREIERLASMRMNPDPVSLLSMGEKATIVGKTLSLPTHDRDDLSAVVTLRNDAAHDKPLATDLASLDLMIERLDRAHWWIDDLGRRLRKAPA